MPNMKTIFSCTNEMKTSVVLLSDYPWNLEKKKKSTFVFVKMSILPLSLILLLFPVHVFPLYLYYKECNMLEGISSTFNHVFLDTEKLWDHQVLLVVQLWSQAL